MSATSGPNTATSTLLAVAAALVAAAAVTAVLYQRSLSSSSSSSSSSSTRKIAATSPRRSLPRDIRVVDLVIYPVKSCAAVRVKAAWVNQFGFEFDRQWIIVDKDGNMLTQREHPKMALIKPTLSSSEAGPDAYSHGGSLTLSHESASSTVTVPFRKSFEAVRSVPIPVWKSVVDGVDEGDEAARWVSQVLGVEARLFVKDPRTRRSLPAKHTPGRESYSHDPQTAFADGFPFLLTSTTSLADVNARFKEISPSLPTLDTLNFRPNIVVAAAPGGDGEPALAPFVEESFKTIAIGPDRQKFYVASRCTRCQMPGVDFTKGTANPEVSKALMKFRRADPGDRFQACFGMNLSHADTGFVVRVGDQVAVVEFGVHNRKEGMWRPGM